ncbi:MAG: hypothetical protein AAFR70_13755, partial [Pseudomonadota bacterium]
MFAYDILQKAEADRQIESQIPKHKNNGDQLTSNGVPAEPNTRLQTEAAGPGLTRAIGTRACTHRPVKRNVALERLVGASSPSRAKAKSRQACVQP